MSVSSIETTGQDFTYQWNGNFSLMGQRLLIQLIQDCHQGMHIPELPVKNVTHGVIGKLEAPGTGPLAQHLPTLVVIQGQQLECRAGCKT